VEELEGEEFGSSCFVLIANYQCFKICETFGFGERECALRHTPHGLPCLGFLDVAGNWSLYKR